MQDVLIKAYQSACEEGCEEDAAYLARKIRDRLLDESDKEMTLDRLNLDFSSPIKFIASLKSVVSDVWSKYRQDLRDLPSQEGFPFNVRFPSRPGDPEESVDNEYRPFNIPRNK